MPTYLGVYPYLSNLLIHSLCATVSSTSCQPIILPGFTSWALRSHYNALGSTTYPTVMLHYVVTSNKNARLCLGIEMTRIGLVKADFIKLYTISPDNQSSCSKHLTMTWMSLDCSYLTACCIAYTAGRRLQWSWISFVMVSASWSEQCFWLTCMN